MEPPTLARTIGSADREVLTAYRSEPIRILIGAEVSAAAGAKGTIVACQEARCGIRGLLRDRACAYAGDD
jgi:hypothetical protein